MGKYILLTLFVAGCTCLPRTLPQEPFEPSDVVLWKTIKSTDWLMSIYLLAITCGIFAGLNGLKWGWTGAFASFVGALLKAALSNTWVYLVAGLGLAGCVLLLAASILLRKKALVEIIKSVQAIKTAATTDYMADSKQVSAIAAAEQSKSTQRVVQQIKGGLKVKGEI